MKTSTLLIDLFEKQYRPIRLVGTSAQGSKLHRVSLNNFARFLGRPARLSDLSDETLSGFLTWHLDVRGNSRFTANRDAARLLALWRFACRRGLVKIWPELPKLPEPQRMPQAWSLQQYGEILAACRQVMYRVCGIPGALWWTALHLVIYDSAERIGAVLSVLWGDVDLDGEWLLVRAEFRKGGKSDRGYRLRPETVAALRAMPPGAPGDLVFPFDRTTMILYKRYRKILASAGLPHDRRCMFHRLRRTVASHFARAGGNATDLLDHTSAKITKQSYLDPRIVGQQHAADMLPAIEMAVPQRDERPLSVVVAEYCEHRSAGSETKHWRDKRSWLAGIARRCGCATLADLDASILLAYIDGTDRTRYEHVRDLHQFLTWAASRGPLPDGLLAAIEKAHADWIERAAWWPRGKDGAA